MCSTGPDQVLYIESDNTLREQRPATDMFCIDCVCLAFQIALYRVSAGREREDNKQGQIYREKRKFPEGEQLLCTAKRYIS